MNLHQVIDPYVEAVSGMTNAGRFPFGRPVQPRPSSADEPRQVFVLGAYPSGFHVAWWLPGHENRSRPGARALIVDNEPEVFWDGSGAEEQLTRWRTAVGFDDHSWGRVELPPAGNNGPSGQWLTEQILQPLGFERAQCWITDCLDTARLNPQQAKRIEDAYLPQVDRLGLPVPDMRLSPKGESGIVSQAREGHLDRLRRELGTARPELVITLGNAALRLMRELVEITSLDPGTALRRDAYGVDVSARAGSRSIRWLPLVHPRSGERVPAWRAVHASWVSRTS